jgi:hypothetical protein
MEDGSRPTEADSLPIVEAAGADIFVAPSEDLAAAVPAELIPAPMSRVQAARSNTVSEREAVEKSRLLIRALNGESDLSRRQIRKLIAQVRGQMMGGSPGSSEPVRNGNGERHSSLKRGGTDGSFS